MANYYTDFSAAIRNLTTEEETWLKTVLEVPESIPEMEGSGVELLQDERVQEVVTEGMWPGCAYKLCDDTQEGRYLWLYTEGYAHLESVAMLVQAFLKKFRPYECFALTYAHSCNKPKLDVFSGGYAFITAEDVKWGHIDHDVMVLEREHKAKVREKRAVALLREAQDKLHTADGIVDPYEDGTPFCSNLVEEIGKFLRDY